MKKIIVISFLFAVGTFASFGQSTMTKLDSIRIEAQLKKTADSLKNVTNLKRLQEKKDSMTAARKIKFEADKKTRDSISLIRKNEKKQQLEYTKAFEKNKKAREKAIDSIARASEKAAASRKAYYKKLKSKEYKNKLAKQQKHKEDSVRKEVNRDNRQIKRDEKSKEIIVTKDKYDGYNYYQFELLREPPEKKNSFLGLQLGHSNYLGDLGGNSGIGTGSWKDVSFKENTFMYGFSFTHLRKEVVGIRFSYISGQIAGSDRNTFFQNPQDPSYYRYVRNLDFKTKINEASLLLEVHPFKFFSYKKNLHNSYFQPYVLGGVGLFSFNPQGSYFDDILDDNVWFNLAPLRTEGQGMAEYPDRKEYKLTQWNIPYGFGVNYELTPSISFGLEYAGRILFTDYLDDVSTKYIDPNLFDKYLNQDNANLAKSLNNKSQLVDANKAYKPGDIRGNPNNNDFYFTLSGRLVIKLNRNKAQRYKKPSIFKFDDTEICK